MKVHERNSVLPKGHSKAFTAVENKVENKKEVNNTALNGASKRSFLLGRKLVKVEQMVFN